MPQNLPTDLLRSFVTVAEHGSITQAGEILGRSQPAMSLQIKRLEEQLDVALFKRGKRKLVLTEKGKTLFQYAEKILALNDEAINRLTKPFLRGHVHLGIPNEFAASFLPTILRRYAQTHSEVTVQVTCDLSVNLQTRLNKGEFDLVLALQERKKEYQQEGCWSEEVVWVGAEGSESYKNTPLPLIVAPEGCLYRKRMIESLDAQKREWQEVYTSSNFSGIYAGVSAGLGITAVAKSTVVEGLKELGHAERLPQLPDVQMSLLYDEKHISPAAKRLVEYISAQVKPKSTVRKLKKLCTIGECFD